MVGVDFELTPAVENKTFDSSEITEKLKSGEVHLALLLASTKVELIFAETVKQVLGLTDEQFNKIGFGRWSLGKYIDTIKNLNRLTEDEIKNYSIRELTDKRNNLAHDDGYATKLESDDAEKEEVEEIVKDSIKFIDDVVIDYKSNNIIHN